MLYNLHFGIPAIPICMACTRRDALPCHGPDSRAFSGRTNRKLKVLACGRVIVTEDREADFTLVPAEGCTPGRAVEPSWAPEEAYTLDRVVACTPAPEEVYTPDRVVACTRVPVAAFIRGRAAVSILGPEVVYTRVQAADFIQVLAKNLTRVIVPRLPRSFSTWSGGA
jgi:hypothetical protein